MKRQILIPALLLLFLQSSAQSDSITQQPSPFDHRLSLTALAYGGAERYQIAAAYAAADYQMAFRRQQTIAGLNLRLFSGMSFGADSSFLNVREAYVGYAGAKLDLRLGRQIVKWGRTDGFNPVNNVCSQDYFYLAANQEDQQIGNFMARIRWNIGRGAELEMLAMPWYQPSIYRYELFDMGGQARFASPLLPEREPRNGSLGLRLNVERPFAGFSLSYFNGYDPFYGFRVKEIQLFPTVMITYVPAHYRKQSVGGDLAIPLGSWIFRAEAAWDITKSWGDTMQVPNPSISYVAAIEREVAGITCILEYVGKHTLEYEPLVVPVLLDSNDILAQLQYGLAMINYESSRFNRLVHHQKEAWNHAAFLALRKSFAYETLEAELGAYYNFSSDEYFIRPMLRWKLKDALSLHLGAYYMAGPEDEVFDRAGEVLNGLTIGMKFTY